MREKQTTKTGQDSKLYDIVGIGASVYDVLMVVGSYPKEDTKMMAQRTMPQGGGPCSTALVAGAVLGMSTAYIGALGDDAAGDYLLKEFQNYGVDVGGIRLYPGYVSWNSVILLNQESGSRTCVWSSGDLPSLVLDEDMIRMIRRARVLHLDGNHLDAALQGAATARDAGVKVSLDAGSIYPGIEKLFPYVDVMITTQDFLEKITGIRNVEKAAAMLHDQYRPEIFIVTQGKLGGFLFDGTVRRYLSYPVETVDSNGAGDAFHGAFLSAWLKGKGVTGAVEFASAFSAVKCTGLGARKSMPSWERTEFFLRAQKGGRQNGI